MGLVFRKRARQKAGRSSKKRGKRIRLPRGATGAKEVRCPTRHRERSMSPSGQEDMCSKLWLNMKKSKRSPLLEQTDPLSQASERGHGLSIKSGTQIQGKALSVFWSGSLLRRGVCQLDTRVPKAVMLQDITKFTTTKHLCLPRAKEATWWARQVLFPRWTREPAIRREESSTGPIRWAAIKQEKISRRAVL